MIRRTFVGVPTINDIMQTTGNEWHTENSEAMKAVTKSGMKITRNDLPAAVKTRGNG